MSKIGKVLIHFPEDKLAPKGGPAGYLCNLRLGLEEVGAEGFDFLPPAGATYEENKTLRNLIPSRVRDLRRLRNLLGLLSKESPASVDYSQYAAVHFHSTEDLYLHRKALETYGGKVVLTSHSPCVYHEELISRLNPKDAKRKARELRQLEVVDEYAFRRADFVIFPCEEAEEPYFNTWEKYREVRDNGKMRYVPTGIVPASAKVDRDVVRRRYGIPSDAFVVCYVGRHSQIKGYDILKTAAMELLADEDVWFLVAGREGPLYRLDNPKWVEAGWTDDPHSLMAASDVFVLPNRETFFDLIMLEALSLGQIVVASRTGGNKYFEKFGYSGVRLFGGFDEMVRLVRGIQATDEERRAELRLANENLFEREFAVNVFARKYVATMDDICDKGSM